MTAQFFRVVTPDEETSTPTWRLVRAIDTRFTTLISDFLLQPAQRRVEKLELNDPDSGREWDQWVTGLLYAHDGEADRLWQQSLAEDAHVAIPVIIDDRLLCELLAFVV